MASRFLILMMPALLLLPGALESTTLEGTPAITLEKDGATSGSLKVNVTDGWEFHLEKPVTVTSLGVFDCRRDGLKAAVPVGLWDDDGELLARTVIPAGTESAERDGFRYEPIASVRLEAGRRYVIAAGYRPETGECVVGGDTAIRFFSDGAIRWLGRRRVVDQDGLVFPGSVVDQADPGVNPGGFGPNFLVAEPAGPRSYYHTHRVDESNKYVMVRRTERPDGSHRRDLVILISLYARKNGELTQILVNGDPLGTGTQALNTVAARVSLMSHGIRNMTGVRPDVRIAAPSWIRYPDLMSVVDACSGRVNSTLRRTQALRVEMSTFRDSDLPLVNADVDGRFVDHGEAVEDTWTGLLWQKDGSAAGRKNYPQAVDYADGLTLAGLTGWRLPSIEELASVFPADDAPFVGTGYTTDECCEPDREYNSYWTSELDQRKDDYAFVYHWYGRGGSNNCFASRNFVNVRCVRDVDESLKTSRVTQVSLEKPVSVARADEASSRPESPVRRTPRALHSSGDPRKRPFVEYLRRNVIGRTIAGKVVSGLDQGRLESEFARRTTFTRLRESRNGFGFDEVIDIRETIRNTGRSGRDSDSVRHDNRRVILRHQYSVRKSTGEVVGYAREVSHVEGQLSEAAVVMRAVAEIQNGELIIRTTTVGYDDHVTADGLRPGAVQAQSKFSVHAGRLQRSQANENFAVNPRSLVRRPSRRETELMVEVEVN